MEDLNRRPFKRLDGCRRDWFERLDRPALRALPVQPYEVATFKRCKVSYYHIEVNGSFYSVPSALARQSVDVRLTAQTLEVLHGNRRVASHVLLGRRGAYSTQREHMPAAHLAHREWTPQRLLDRSERIGPYTRQLIDHQLTHKPHPEMGYRLTMKGESLRRKKPRSKPHRDRCDYNPPPQETSQYQSTWIDQLLLFVGDSVQQTVRNRISI